MHIIYNAFSFVREKLSKQGLGYLNVSYEVEEGIDAHGLIAKLGLAKSDVEAVFVNHTVVPKHTILQEGDRVALVPPGTPGSYRLILGLKEMGEA